MLGGCKLAGETLNKGMMGYQLRLNGPAYNKEANFCLTPVALHKLSQRKRPSLKKFPENSTIVDWSATLHRVFSQILLISSWCRSVHDPSALTCRGLKKRTIVSVLYPVLSLANNKHAEFHTHVGAQHALTFLPPDRAMKTNTLGRLSSSKLKIAVRGKGIEGHGSSSCR